MAEKYFYGGQAVLEGVMMRGRSHYAVAVRHPDGHVVVKSEELTASIYRSAFWRLPFLRGLAGLWEQMHLGYSALSWSANQQAAGEDVELSEKQVGFTVVLALVLGTAVFVGIPLLVTNFVYHGRRGDLWFTLFEGVIRTLMLIGYLAAISRLPDIRRVFQYHGAEHKTINCYEGEDPIDVEHVARHSLLHPRCGTGFLLVVALVSVFIFSLASLFGSGWLFVVGSRIILIPLIASLSYEFIRLAGRHRDHPVWKVILVPVLATQKLTTREPDAEQMEVAIAAFEAARAHDLPLAA